jgi:hypothetical protein
MLWAPLSWRRPESARGTRALGCWRQAVFALAWFRDRLDVARLGRGFGISQATAYRYLDEAIQVLAAQAPGLRKALEQAKQRGPPHLILDGKVVAADRLKEKAISRKGKEIDRWYSGKAHGVGGNIQALFSSRHPAMGLPGPAGRHPRHHRRPRARARHRAALPQGSARAGRLRVRRSRLRHSSPGQEASRQRGT